MKRPSILGGIAFAFVVSVFAVPTWWGLKMALPLLAVRLIALIPYLAYCLYLLRAARTRVGALTLATVNLVIGTALVSLPVSSSSVMVVLVGLISLNRSLLFHRNLVSMALDGVLSGLGLVFAGYLFNETGSLPTALWSFFLLQSMFVMIPARLSETGGLFSGGQGVDPFLHGQRQAEAALERIVEQAPASDPSHSSGV